MATLFTVRSLIRGVPAHWDAQYKQELRDGNPYHCAISRKLHALNPDTASAADVAGIIGNYSWTRLVCNECKEKKDAVVEVGDAPDYDSATARLCLECLLRAIELLRKGK